MLKTKIMAIDASTKSTGISIFENTRLIHYECIEVKSIDTFKRIEQMTQKIKQKFLFFKPDIIVMEDVLPQDVNHNQNVFKALIYLQAFVVLMFHKEKMEVEFYNASHWRKVCGIKTGRGIKRQQLKKASQKLVKQRYNIDVNDDISDAICLGRAYGMQNLSAF